MGPKKKRKVTKYRGVNMEKGTYTKAKKVVTPKKTKVKSKTYGVRSGVTTKTKTVTKGGRK